MSTIDPGEVLHFDNLAATWWDPHGSSRLLHRMNPLRLEFIKSLLPVSESSNDSRYLRGYSILDVGCGGGILTESFARLGATTKGIDASSKAVEVAKAHLRTDPILMRDNSPKYDCNTIQGSGLDELYDIVTAMEVLEHVEYPSIFLDDLARRVKPGGWLILSTISRSWTAWAGAIIAAERILRIVPVGTHSWRKFINEPELRDYFAKLKCDRGRQWATVVRTRGCVYSPLRGEWFFTEKQTLGVFNYLVAVRKAM